MAEFTFTIWGEEELLRKFSRLRAIFFLRPPMDKSLLLLLGEFQRYPPPAHKKMKFKSRKQRLFVLAAIRDGRIHIPYRRRHSAGLAGAWVHRATVQPNAIEGTLVNHKPYGPFVLDPKSQAQYHRGTWPTTADVFKKQKPHIEMLFQEAVYNALRKA